MKFVARAVKVTIELLECSLIFAVVYAQVLDDKNVRRRFRASNYQVQVLLPSYCLSRVSPSLWELQSTTRVKPFICTMPMRLDEGWNQIQFNLSDFTRRAYGSQTLASFFFWTHFKCIRNKLYRNAPCPNTRQLPHQAHLLFRPSIYGGGAATRV